MVGQGLRQKARSGSYAGELPEVLFALGQQQNLHWARIGNTFYADDAARSGGAAVELKTMSRSAFEQTLRDMRISVSEAQITFDAGNNVLRIAGPPPFITDLERVLSTVRARAPTLAAQQAMPDIKVIKFGIISHASN
jgi:hypothetical protein